MRSDVNTRIRDVKGNYKPMNIKGTRFSNSTPKLYEMSSCKFFDRFFGTVTVIHSLCSNYNDGPTNTTTLLPVMYPASCNICNPDKRAATQMIMRYITEYLYYPS